MRVILGIEMITQVEVGELIGTKSRSTISAWLSRADISGVAINGTNYYSVEQIKDYLRYGKLEIRKAVELMREVQLLNRGRK